MCAKFAEDCDSRRTILHHPHEIEEDKHSDQSVLQARHPLIEPAQVERWISCLQVWHLSLW
jgi:hypothetical protein